MTVKNSTGPENTGGLGRCVLALPSYLKKNGYKTPGDMTDGPLQYSHDTKFNMFEWLHANPPAGLQFNNHMGGYSTDRPSWMDDGFYPVEERLLRGFNTSSTSGGGGDGKGSALLVDIGGGLGHDIEAFSQKFPRANGRLVLQDLEHVIGQVERKDDSIERTIYNFHTEQPVKGK